MINGYYYTGTPKLEYVSNSWKGHEAGTHRTLAAPSDGVSIRTAPKGIAGETGHSAAEA